MSSAMSALKTSPESNCSSPSSFETARAIDFCLRRKEFLDQFLPAFVRSLGVQSALDVGCGFGFFSQYLDGLGLRVTAIDGREENVREVRKRIPNIKCLVADVEDVAERELGQFDLVFCFGLLYHLENPFKVLRNLESLTSKVCLLETVVAPVKEQATILYEEPSVANQGLDYIAAIPSEAWFLKSLYRVGFPKVFRSKVLPNHPDFHSGLFKKRMRTVLLAAKSPLDFEFFEHASEPEPTNAYLWDRAGLGYFLRHEGLRDAIKRIVPARLLRHPNWR